MDNICCLDVIEVSFLEDVLAARPLVIRQVCSFSVDPWYIDFRLWRIDSRRRLLELFAGIRGLLGMSALLLGSLRRLVAAFRTPAEGIGEMEIGSHIGTRIEVRLIIEGFFLPSDRDIRATCGDTFSFPGQFPCLSSGLDSSWTNLKAGCSGAFLGAANFLFLAGPCSSLFPAS